MISKNITKSLFQTSARSYNKVLTRANLSDNILKAEYAVRGKIPLRGEEIQNEINSGITSYPFSRTTSLNIGNPQAVGQGHITFNREVRNVCATDSYRY